MQKLASLIDLKPSSKRKLPPRHHTKKALKDWSGFGRLGFRAFLKTNYTSRINSQERSFFVGKPRPQGGVLPSEAPPALPLPAGPPQLTTRRLALRGLRLGDAARIRRLAGDRAVAENTLRIPHPYEEGMAKQWIREQKERYEEGREVTFAIVPRRGKGLIGMIGLVLTEKHSRGELGYWIGKPYWSRGYATEAAEAVLRYGFETLRLHRIWAGHFGRNPASGRVLEKIGMTYEGTRRQHVLKWGKFEDLVGYGMLRTDFEKWYGS